MITIYLDWGVLSQMRRGSQQILLDILSNKEKFWIIYSTSHIGDIFAGYDENDERRKLINDDLEFLSRLTNNSCLSNDGKKITLSFRDPKELFEESVADKDLFKNYSLDTLSGLLTESPELQRLSKSYTEHLRNLPLDRVFVEALQNPATGKELNSMFPGLKDNPTMGEFFKCFGEMITRFNENEDYDNLRKIVQSGLKINRDKIFDNPDPFKMLEKTYQQFPPFKNAFGTPDDKYAPKWFNEISNEYLNLDMHGYQEDKINVKKGRKETFRNTTEDAFHAAFSSTCSFYITNDKRSHKKAKAVFEKLGLETFILNSEEFVDFYNTYLFTRPPVAEFEIPIEYLKTEEYTEDVREKIIIRSYYIPYFIYDFFNQMFAVIRKCDGTVESILLGQIGPTNKKITYNLEIETLSKKLYKCLGNDDDNRGEVRSAELEKEEWVGRKWTLDRITFRFIRAEGHYQLYYDFKERKI